MLLNFFQDPMLMTSLLLIWLLLKILKRKLMQYVSLLVIHRQLQIAQQRLQVILSFFLYIYIHIYIYIYIYIYLYIYPLQHDCFKCKYFKKEFTKDETESMQFSICCKFVMVLIILHILI